MDLQDCLPATLRSPETTFTRISGGLSGAAVYRVSTPKGACILKVGGDANHEILKLASGSGVGPGVFHLDAERNAVVYELIADQGFMANLGDPNRRLIMLTRIAATLRRLHKMAPPAGIPPRDVRPLLDKADGFTKPAFMEEAIARMKAETPPPLDRVALSHNDCNPSNLVLDKDDHVRLLDWDAAAPNDRRYDLATVSLFLRLNPTELGVLVAAYGDAEVDERFLYCRRLVATVCGTLFLHLARAAGHTGSSEDTGLSLGDVYLKMRTGQLSPATPDGQFAIGLALVKEI